MSSSKSFKSIKGRKGRRKISQGRQLVIDENVSGQHVVVKGLNKILVTLKYKREMSRENFLLIKRSMPFEIISLNEVT
jgi:hypothetical protein